MTNSRDYSHQHEEGRPNSSNGFWVYGLSGDQSQNNNSQLRGVQLLAHVVGVSAPNTRYEPYDIRMITHSIAEFTDPGVDETEE